MRHAQAPQIAPTAATDANLVGRARARDEAAIRAIMQANNRRLYRIARGILRNDGEAEDVVQETYVRAFTHLQDFRGDWYITCSGEGFYLIEVWGGQKDIMAAKQIAEFL